MGTAHGLSDLARIVCREDFHEPHSRGQKGEEEHNRDHTIEIS
jgi:hypothetical protein